MSSRTRWLLTVLAGLVLLGFLVSGGHERNDDPPPAIGAEEAEGDTTVRMPMPGPAEVKSAMEEARGLYTLKARDRTFTIDLMEQRRFRFVVAITGKPLREATGTWTLVGNRLTMSYTQVPGRPEITPANPDVVTNVWRGTTIELKDPSFLTPVILRKRTAIRQK